MPFPIRPHSAQYTRLFEYASRLGDVIFGVMLIAECPRDECSWYPRVHYRYDFNRGSYDAIDNHVGDAPRAEPA